MFDLVFRNARVAQPDGSTLEADVGCKSGMVQKIANIIDRDAGETIDANGHLLLPGVIDPQVHFREPGATHKEDLGSGSRAAVRGGVTSFLEMPNCHPPTTNQEELNWKLSRAAQSSVANYGFFVGASKDNLEALNDCHPSCGIKIFLGSSTGNLLVDDMHVLEQIFANGERLIAVHAEDEARIRERTSTFLGKLGNSPSIETHSQIRDPETALIATQRVVELSRKYGRRLHILHLSTAEETEYLRMDKPQQVTCEVVPNHLFLSTDDYQELGSRAQMNPPVRAPGNADSLWQGLHDAVIDIIATDHAPHTLEEKQKPYPLSPSGMPGVETSLPLMLTELVEGNCSLKEIQEWMCFGPARLYGIPDKGIIAEGFNADLTLVDLEHYRPVKNEEIFSRAGWSPFSGRKLTGWPLYTVVGGQVVFDHGQIRPGVFGKALTFIQLDA